MHGRWFSDKEMLTVGTWLQMPVERVHRPWNLVTKTRFGMTRLVIASVKLPYLMHDFICGHTFVSRYI